MESCVKNGFNDIEPAKAFAWSRRMMLGCSEFSWRFCTWSCYCPQLHTLHGCESYTVIGRHVVNNSSSYSYQTTHYSHSTVIYSVAKQVALAVKAHSKKGAAATNDLISMHQKPPEVVSSCGSVCCLWRRFKHPILEFLL